VIIETGEVPDGVLDALLKAAPDDPGDGEVWRQALAVALTAWENRPHDPIRLTYAVAHPHECIWRTVGVQPHVAMLGVKVTDALQRCDGCGDVRTQVLTGTWTLDQLRG
jgi:hypothetical protein